LLRRGLSLKKAEKLLKNTPTNPTNYGQWKLLRKYHKSQCLLSAAQPQLETKASVDLSPFTEEYDAIAAELEHELAACGGDSGCGRKNEDCCWRYFELQLAESIRIHQCVNRTLSHDDREHLLEHAQESRSDIRIIRTLHAKYPPLADKDFTDIYAAAGSPCPLLESGKCFLPANRPFRCRWAGTRLSSEKKKSFEAMLTNLSRDVFLALTGSFPPQGSLHFCIADTVSGHFVQECFSTMRLSNQ
jgi:hypothetical protein